MDEQTSMDCELGSEFHGLGIRGDNRRSPPVKDPTWYTSPADGPALKLIDHHTVGTPQGY